MIHINQSLSPQFVFKTEPGEDKMKTELITDYDEFLKENRVKVNRYMNRVLWLFVTTGPAIALGIKCAIFNDITYTTCLCISAIVVLLSSIHLFLYKKFPSRSFTCIFALGALDALLVYMNLSHVSIYLTWFLVPLLSLLFCNKYLYFCTSAVNYLLMGMTTWIIAPYEVTIRSE